MIAKMRLTLHAVARKNATSVQVCITPRFVPW